ncbi:MAG: signal peptidase II [Chloroflexi bacterium]|nr:signal peptidase II [Chloroflexota bacterium]MBP7043800.1 signal peptidase II [Chloroflexota bacterium]
MTELEQSNSASDGAVVVRSATWAQRFLPLLIAALVILLDQGSKQLIEATIPYNTSWVPIERLAPFFQITHTGNTGIAFGLFAGGSVLFAIVALVVTGIILFYNFTLTEGNVGLRIVLGLLLGGALGNLIDRVRLGHVTDFLDFGPWPIFNVADTAVVAGALALAYLMWAESRREAQQRHSQETIHPQNE